MKYILFAVGMLALASCIEDGEDITNRGGTISVCIDGVEYWITDLATSSQSTAPRIDPDTLTFVKCKSEDK
jgi:hypothetical protein